MTYLAIETAYDVCGVALVSASGVEALEEQVAPRQANELLAVSVDQLLADSGQRLSDLDGIALSVGPGSYTGLRIGMSYAKGLALGTGLPVIPVPTLPSLLVDEGLSPPYWVATWSHGVQIYAARVDRGDHFGEVQSMTWDAFATLAEGETVAGYLLDRFLVSGGPTPAGRAMTVLETCPSAGKIGKFALERGLSPASDLGTLIPDYHHKFQVKPFPEGPSGKGAPAQQSSPNQPNKRINHVHS